MKNIKIVAMLSLLSTGAFAGVPAKYADCDQNVREPRESTGYFWDRSCSTVYVMPPSRHLLSIEALNYQVSDAECQVVNDQLSAYRSRTSAIRSLIDSPERSESRIRAIDQRLDQLHQREARSARKRLELLDRKQEAAAAQATLETRIAGIEAEKAACLERTQYCSVYDLRLSREQRRLTQVQALMGRITSQLESLTETGAFVSEQVVELNRQRDALLPNMDEQMGTLNRLATELEASLAVYRNQSGGTISFLMENTHQNLVRSFTRLNQGLNIMPMPAQYAVQFAVSTEDALLSENVSGISIPGMSIPTEESTSNFRNIAFGNSLSGSVELNKLSACMLRDGVSDIDEQAARFVVNLHYNYNLNVRSRYELSFNKSELFKKVISNKTRGGFFRTKSVNKISRELTQSEHLKVNFFAEDPRDNLNTEAKEEVKKAFIDRVLASITRSYLSHTEAASLGLIPTSDAAAPQLANGVRSNCSHKYCQFAALALDVTHAMFGGNDQAAEFLSRQDFMATETVSQDTAIEEYSTATFVIRAR